MADSGEIREDLKLEGTQTNKAEYDRLFEECEKAKRTNKPPEELEPFSVSSFFVYVCHGEGYFVPGSYSDCFVVSKCCNNICRSYQSHFL